MAKQLGDILVETELISKKTLQRAPWNVRPALTNAWGRCWKRWA